MQRRVVLLVALLLCLPAVALADPTITIGNYNLSTSNQVQLFISGGDSTAGAQLNFLINGGAAGAPTLTSVDLIGAGTIFAPNHNPQSNAGFPGLETASGVTTASGTVNATGLLATLTFDTTTGVVGTGPWSLSIQDSPNFGPSSWGIDADFNPVPIVGDNGTVFLNAPVTPEPSSIVLGLFAVAGLGAVAARKHRARRVA